MTSRGGGATKWSLAIGALLVSVVIVGVVLRDEPAAPAADGATEGAEAPARALDEQLPARGDVTGRVEARARRTTVGPPDCAVETGRVEHARSLHVRGTVVDAQSDRGVEGATVVLRLGDHSEAIARVATDEDGRFSSTIDAVPGDVRRIDARATCPGYMPESESTLLHHTNEAVEFAFRVQAGAVLVGRVLDADGEPAAHAWVEVVREDGEGSSYGDASDAGGAFEFGVPESGAFVVHARAEGRGASRPSSISLVPGDPLHVELHLERGLALAGVVVDPTGAPIAGLHVDVLARAYLDAMGHSMDLRRFPGVDYSVLPRHETRGIVYDGLRTDERGRFAFQGLLDGEFLLFVGCAGEDATWRVRAGTTDLRLTVDTYRLEVHVVDERGATVDDARVAISDASGSAPVGTRGGGRVEIVVQPGRTYLVEACDLAEWRGEATREVPIVAGRFRTACEIRLPAAGRPGTLVVRAAAEAGAEDAGRGISIRVASPRSGSTWIQRIVRDLPASLTLPPGRYRVGVVPDVEYDDVAVILSASPPPIELPGDALRHAWSFGTESEVRIDAGGVTELEWSPAPAGILIARVSSGESELPAVLGFEAVLDDGRSASMQLRRVEADGAPRAKVAYYTTDALWPPGTHRFSAKRYGAGSRYECAARVDAGVVNVISIELE